MLDFTVFRNPLSVRLLHFVLCPVNQQMEIPVCRCETLKASTCVLSLVSETSDFTNRVPSLSRGKSPCANAER